MDRRVDFFIVGAPKCATSAMADYLNQHPDIYIPSVKEPSFFGEDITRSTASLKEYEELFCDGKGKVCGEGSTWYLYSTAAAREIREYNPMAKIIIMLRNPIDVMYSLHSQNLYNGNVENIERFFDALQAEPERHDGKRVPPGCGRVEALYYTDVVRFAEQVKRYFDTFGKEQVRVIMYDDFKENAEVVYRRTLEFLGVNPSFRAQFGLVNANKKLRSRWLHDILRRPPSMLKVVAHILPSSSRRRVLGMMSSMNVSTKPRPALDPRLRRKLLKDFETEIHELGILLGRDLSQWTVSS